MTSSLEGKIRSLERKLVRERAYLTVLDLVDAVMLRWDRFAASGDDALFLLLDLGANRIGLPTLSGAVSYLNTCRNESRTPNPHHLANYLAPWAAAPQRSWK